MAGTRCAAWLYRPANAAGLAPCVVMAHGFAGVARIGSMPTPSVSLGPVSRSWSSTIATSAPATASHAQLLDIDQELDDWRSAIAFARSLDRVDPQRIALWGTSFSGGHVMALAAKDSSLAAVVSQAPFADGWQASGSVSLRQFLRLPAPDFVISSGHS